MKKLLFRLLAVLSLALGFSTSAHAVLCLASTSAPIFGNYTGVEKISAGTVTVTCTQLIFAQDVSYRIHFSYGNWGTGTQRRMRGVLSNNYMNYNYTCPGNPAKVLGDGTGNTCEFVGGQANLLGVLVTPFSVTGVIPGGQSPQPGTYNDSVTATILY